MASKFSDLTGYEKPLEQFNRDEIRAIAGNYGIKLSSIIEQKLNKSQVIDLIRSNKKYQQAKQNIIDQDLKTSVGRINLLKKKIAGVTDPDIIMGAVTSIFSETDSYPREGNYYTFVYNAKTPRMIYDQYPLVAVLSVQSWGFFGINFHWGTQRNYTWEEISSLFHIINNEEIEEMKNIPYSKFITK